MVTSVQEAPSWRRITAPAHAEAVRRVRRDAAATLLAWGVVNHDDVVLVISELVANAVRHARSGPGPGGQAGQAGQVALLLVRRDSHLLCAVKDQDGVRGPAPRAPGADDECGRGLGLIGALSDAWGCTALTNGGKAVWAVFRQPGPALKSST